ncbi:MAG: Ig-like domain-containing domain [Sulfuricaulis sp.]
MSAYKSYPRVFKLSLAALVLLIFVAGCGGGGGGGGGSGNTNTSSGTAGSGSSAGPKDTTIPTVTFMTPGQDAPGIGTNARITATFTEAMTASDITAASFRFTDGSSYLPGTVSFDSNNNIAVLTPATSLTPGVRYTATIVTGIRDLDGNPISRDFAWDFVPGTTVDTTAPTVTSTIPANADTGVALNREISATFSKDMNSFTLTPANFTVTGPGATKVPGTVNYINGTAIFTPAHNLAPNAVYTVMVGTGTMDLEGNAIAANVAWSFTTGATADTTAPVVVSTNPAGAASGVPVNSTINASFNKPMDPTTITTANFLVTGPGTTPVIGTVAFDPSTNSAIFTRINHLITPMAFDPTITYLDPSTTYTATLTTGAKDMAGNPLAANMVWSFTTAP